MAIAICCCRRVVDCAWGVGGLEGPRWGEGVGCKRWERSAIGSDTGWALGTKGCSVQVCITRGAFVADFQGLHGCSCQSKLTRAVRCGFERTVSTESEPDLAASVVCFLESLFKLLKCERDCMTIPAGSAVR